MLYPQCVHTGGMHTTEEAPALAIRHATQERAEQAAATLADKYPERIWFVDTDELVATHRFCAYSI